MHANKFCDAGQVPIFRYFEACRELVFAVLATLFNVFVAGSTLDPVNSNKHFRKVNRHKILPEIG